MARTCASIGVAAGENVARQALGFAPPRREKRFERLFQHGKDLVRQLLLGGLGLLYHEHVVVFRHVRKADLAGHAVLAGDGPERVQPAAEVLAVV